MPRFRLKYINNAALGIAVEVAYAAAIICAGIALGAIVLWWLR